MKFSKFVLSMLTVTLLGTTVMPAYAADGSKQTYPCRLLEQTSEQEWEMEGKIAISDDDSMILADKMDSISLIATNDYDLDAEYAAEVSDYKLSSSSVTARAAAKSVQYARSWKIYRKSDHATMVQWVLTGVFTYDGKTSKCMQTSMTNSNKDLGTYQVTSSSHYPSRNYAIGNCKAVNKKTGKSYARVIKFGVTKNGTLVTG